jgi:predicted ferric reductase
VTTYLYRELLMQRLLPQFAHIVAEVDRPTERVLVVTLAAQREAVRLVPGQYVYVHFGTEGWRPHPFTVAGSDDDGRLRLAVQTAGNETADLYEKLAPGVPVRIFGPHGRFDYRSGGPRQVWIAAGVGITPFHSWIRSLDSSFDREVQFFYTAPDIERALFADEITSAARNYPSLQLRLVASEREGRLSPEQVAAVVPEPHGPVWVYMCGPLDMMRTFEKDLRRLGFAKRRIVWERFEVR